MTEKKFETLHHTADLKIKVFGKTKKELFQNALFGMVENLKPKLKNKQKTKQKVEVKSFDRQTLLVDFLNEILYLSQANKEVYNEIKFKKLTDNELEVEVIGQKIKSLEKEIKAVTYHGLTIYQKKDKNWEAVILFDI